MRAAIPAAAAAAFDAAMRSFTRPADAKFVTRGCRARLRRRLGCSRARHTATVTGKLDGHDHPFVEHFKFVKQFEDGNTVARQTMPSPRADPFRAHRQQDRLPVRRVLQG